jgi:hypothetical protein
MSQLTRIVTRFVWSELNQGFLAFLRPCPTPLMRITDKNYAETKTAALIEYTSFLA